MSRQSPVHSLIHLHAKIRISSDLGSNAGKQSNLCQETVNHYLFESTNGAVQRH